ncbi:glycosyltransferase [Candidatus Roizmanbacteria bacterium]|nr:glycosyltransferase [Candidatus Roizmanbacteria bacterium]
MKILITGGHFTPAVSLIEALQKKYTGKKSVSIVFVGRKFISESEKTHSLEYLEMTKRNIQFIHLETGRLTRILSAKTIINLLHIPVGFYNAFRIIQKERPNLILSFGGYIALPLVFWAYCFRIPICTHEQTIQPGLANRMIGKLASKIFIAFKEAESYFDQNKVNIAGNLVRETVLRTIRKPFIVKKDRPVLYVTGGSLGSHSINMHIFALLTKLLKKYIVIHQIGDTKEYEDYEGAKRIKKLLPSALKRYYYPRKHFFENEIGYIYSLTDLVIGRAGANTFFELIALQKPALFIPLPWAAYNEQQKHAEIFEKYKTGVIFHQSDTSKHLFQMIEEMMKNIDKYKINFKSLQHLYKKNAAAFILKEIMGYC